jgi:hypothetical protein
MTMPRSARSAVASLALAVSTVLAACGSSTPTSGSTTTTASAATGSTGSTNGSAATTAPVAGTRVTFVAEVWADNWFSLYANGTLVGEDSVPLMTERSFNAETIVFEATYPLTIAMVTKDYKANDSGLEYIGTSRQQMGDGGFIAQIKEKASGRLVATTGPSWRGLVVHRAPLNPSCEKAADPMTACRFETVPEPTGWTLPGFDDRTWAVATTYTSQQVGTKEGYDTIRWASAASLIWSSDLKLDNTILWRVTVA